MGSIEEKDLIQEWGELFPLPFDSDDGVWNHFLWREREDFVSTLPPDVPYIQFNDRASSLKEYGQKHPTITAILQYFGLLSVRYFSKNIWHAIFSNALGFSIWDWKDLKLWRKILQIPIVATCNIDAFIINCSGYFLNCDRKGNSKPHAFFIFDSGLFPCHPE